MPRKTKTGIIRSQTKYGPGKAAKHNETNRNLHRRRLQRQPRPGGWGAILRFRTSSGKVFEKEISGGEASTTNNRMELTGLLEALRQLKEPCAIDLYSDSQYVINGLEKGWAKGWRARGWKKADKSPALNPDLWAPLLEESEKHVIRYHWLKGHAGHPENERCDRMAVEQSKRFGGRQA